jgi:hypothetical protein
MQKRTKNLSALALLAVITAVPAHLTAQQPEPQPEPQPITQECTAQVTPAQVTAGEAAVQVRVTFSEAIGAVAGLDAASESGVQLAAPGDLPPTEMAAGEEQPRAIRMAEGQNTWNVWLNTSEANEGTHQLTFQAENGQCSAEITIEPAS